MSSPDDYIRLTRSCSPWPWWPEAIAHVHEVMRQDSGHDWAHLARVHLNARSIWRGEARRLADPEASWRLIAMAALCHDLINLPKDSPERHLASAQSGEHAARWARERGGFSQDEAERLSQIIRTHSYSLGERAASLEAEILCDADRLDALGAIGIARTFAVGGKLDRAIAHALDPLAAEREPDDSRYGVDHFYTKLLRLKDQIYTETGRQLAATRHEFMLAFLRQLAAEVL